jgi:phosphoglycerate dehydrogenase-like enzyme
VRTFRSAHRKIIVGIAGDMVMNETVGFIGLGVMGRPMAKHILAKGYKLVGCNRSRGPGRTIS